MSGALATAVAAPAPASVPAGASCAAPANDAGVVDFSALLAAAPAAAVTTTAATALASLATAPTAPTVAAAADAPDPNGVAAAPDGTDDDSKPGDATLDNAALPGLLLALRQSLAFLVGSLGTAGTPTGDARPRARAAPAPGLAPTHGAKPAAAVDPADAALAALASDGSDGTADTIDPSTPTADQRFDAMLAAMNDHATTSAAVLTAADPLTALASKAAGGSAASAGAAPLSAPPMTVPPDHPQFVGDLGERIVWIADASLDSGIGSAKIELHPLELGSVSVHVRMHGDAAQVAFAADNPATRALLQDSLPQLRELLSVQGLQLLRAQVEQRVGATRASDTGFSQSRERDDGGAHGAGVRRVTRLELVDAYA
ncbi:flagellar hook-length control protein FliK [Solimonas terrae]|uniref:Flagellar hook-length control protein FliK n=1 Tax=Solimonas terrae TaxID=1396819 RepID=A0A6M2BW91_9GAMM|nr:flagellar hook-length control protein FliK [Solimonas terrae]NGY06912.1 flagellar hook-length control protein FliK [Solimonas terrae]